MLDDHQQEEWHGFSGTGEKLEPDEESWPLAIFGEQSDHGLDRIYNADYDGNKQTIRKAPNEEDLNLSVTGPENANSFATLIDDDSQNTLAGVRLATALSGQRHTNSKCGGITIKACATLEATTLLKKSQMTGDGRSDCYGRNYPHSKSFSKVRGQKVENEENEIMDIDTATEPTVEYRDIEENGLSRTVFGVHRGPQTATNSSPQTIRVDDGICSPSTLKNPPNADEEFSNYYWRSVPPSSPLHMHEIGDEETYDIEDMADTNSSSTGYEGIEDELSSNIPHDIYSPQPARNSPHRVFIRYTPPPPQPNPYIVHRAQYDELDNEVDLVLPALDEPTVPTGQEDAYGTDDNEIELAHVHSVAGEATAPPSEDGEQDGGGSESMETDDSEENEQDDENMPTEDSDYEDASVQFYPQLTETWEWVPSRGSPAFTFIGWHLG